MLRKGLVAACMLMVILAAGVVRAGDSITLWVDDRRVTVDVPPRIENGRLLVPVRNVLEAMGMTVQWQDGNVILYTHQRYFSPVGGGDALHRNSSPQELNALGAASALTRYLAEKQAASLEGDGPHIVRFELLDIRDLCRWMAPPDLTERCWGFEIAARIFYVQFKSQNPSAAVAQYERVREPDGIREGSVRRSVQASWYEDVIYEIHPIGPAIYRREGDRETVTYGSDGWVVKTEQIQVKQKVYLPHTPYLVHGSLAR